MKSYIIPEPASVAALQNARYHVHVSPRDVGTEEPAIAVRDVGSKKSFLVRDVQFTGTSILENFPAKTEKTLPNMALLEGFNGKREEHLDPYHNTSCYLTTADSLVVTGADGVVYLVNDPIEVLAEAYPESFIRNNHGC